MVKAINHGLDFTPLTSTDYGKIVCMFLRTLACSPFVPNIRQILENSLRIDCAPTVTTCDRHETGNIQYCICNDWMKHFDNMYE